MTLLIDTDWRRAIEAQIAELGARLAALERRVAEIDEHEPSVGASIEAMQWHIQQLLDFMENTQANEERHDG
jgi:prefoldin subunit 5